MRADAWLAYDAASGMGVGWKVEPGTERTLVQGQQKAHVAAILEDNKRLKSINPTGDSALGRHEATIPNSVMTEWLVEWQREGVPLHVCMNWKHPEMQRRIATKLNDPEWRHLRTAEGHF